MHNHLRLGIGLAGLAIALAGCSSTEAKETKDLRDSMSGTKPFDINNVPEKDRAIVERMRGGGGAPGGGPPSPGGR
ncbi:hypothetical protein EON82_03305 [bacterium]|nr:MAG: hypothetical protein EON82_03305 [bacterium]